MKKQLSIALLAILLTLPVIGVRAQDTAPTSEAFPTVVQEPVTIEPVPTAAPTDVPAAPPIDPTKVTEGLFSTVSVLVASLVAVLFTVILGVAVGLPLVVRVILLTVVKNVVNLGQDYAKTTETKTDDAAFEELQLLVARLEAELNKTNVQVAQNKSDIAQTAQTVNRAAQG